MTLLHLSPPCQALSGLNAHRSYHRFEERLVPLLQQVGRAGLCLSQVLLRESSFNQV